MKRLGIQFSKESTWNERWPDPDSNQGHADFQSAALPTELSGHTTPLRAGRE
jgi:hypothetical protein